MLHFLPKSFVFSIPSHIFESIAGVSKGSGTQYQLKPPEIAADRLPVRSKTIVEGSSGTLADWRAGGARPSLRGDRSRGAQWTLAPDKMT
jgi:hypothetical protein